MKRMLKLLAGGMLAVGCSRSSADHAPDSTRDTVPLGRNVAANDSAGSRTSSAAVASSSDTTAACDHAQVTDTIGRSEYAPVRQFLELLAHDGSVNPDRRQDVHFTSLDALLSFVSDSGLTYVDVNSVGDIGSDLEGEMTTTNSDTLIHVRLDSLRSLMRSERGSLYGHLQSVAKAYGDEGNGYQRIRYCAIPDGVVAILGVLPDYSLAFRRESGRLRLTRFAALELAAD
jgi:hypothetical protein